MDDKELIPYILKHLGDAEDPKDVIFAVCEKSNLAWPEAEALVRKVQEEHSEDITLHQAPILTAIALWTFFGGLAALAYGIYPFVVAAVGLVQQGKFIALLTSQETQLLINIMLRTGINPFIAIFVGAAMILGSQLGMRDVWVAILSRLKIGE